MSRPALTRRALVAGLEAGIPASAASPTFDAAAYVQDLEAIGCRLAVLPSTGGAALGAWSYAVGSPRGRGFGRAHLDVMRRWHDAIEACEDHGALVADYLRARGGAGA